MSETFGTYKIADSYDSNSSARLISADNTVGDIYKIEIENIKDEHRAVLVNRFNQKTAVFDSDFSRKLSLLKAKNMNIVAVLSLVGFSENKKPNYWAEFAVFSYSLSQSDLYEIFIANISKKIRDGIRINLSLSEEEEKKIKESQGNYLPCSKVPIPQLKKGEILIKKSASLKERLIEEARKKNPGCYIFGWLFILLVIALVVFLVGKIL